MVGIVTARGDADWPSRELMRAAMSHGGGEYIDPLSLCVDLRPEPGLPGSVPWTRKFDAIILRGVNRSGEIDMQFEVFELVEQEGIPVLNSCRALSLAESKPTTLFLCKKAGLPIPKTVACQTLDVALDVVHEFRNAVIKPLFGSLGIGVERVDYPDEDGRVEACLERWRAICIQEFIPTDGRDIRAFIIGGKLLAAIERRAQGTEWRTNIHQGGQSIEYQLSPYEKEICLRATALIGLEYTGIDILPGPDGPVLLEVNGAPQWYGLAEATGIDVGDAVICRALELARQRKRKTARAGARGYRSPFQG